MRVFIRGTYPIPRYAVCCSFTSSNRIVAISTAGIWYMALLRNAWVMVEVGSAVVVDQCVWANNNVCNRPGNNKRSRRKQTDRYPSEERNDQGRLNGTANRPSTSMDTFRRLTTAGAAFGQMGWTELWSSAWIAKHHWATTVGRGSWGRVTMRLWSEERRRTNEKSNKSGGNRYINWYSQLGWKKSETRICCQARHMRPLLVGQTEGRTEGEQSCCLFLDTLLSDARTSGTL